MTGVPVQCGVFLLDASSSYARPAPYHYCYSLCCLLARATLLLGAGVDSLYLQGKLAGLLGQGFRPSLDSPVPSVGKAWL